MAEESYQNNFFDTEYLKADLKGRSVQGGAVTMAAQGATFFLGMASTVVLARLLTPQDFGLIAMVTAVTGFVVMFKDMGLSMATVQKAEINHGQISTLFWINVALMDRSRLILTDSSGVQEEAPSLGKPVLVMRDTTERPEAVDAGTAKLVGTDRRTIIDNVSTLLTDEKAYNAMANAVNPYGDGNACQRIVAALDRNTFVERSSR